LYSLYAKEQYIVFFFKRSTIILKELSPQCLLPQLNKAGCPAGGKRMTRNVMALVEGASVGGIHVEIT
jgi:hypothetical protein